jgi:lysophospholipase L1-like esterase
MKKIVPVFLFLVCAGKVYTQAIEESHFQNITQGKISLDLFIPESLDTFKINLLCRMEGVEEVVFSIPVVSGEKQLYPYSITKGNFHKIGIEFDLRYNFCKVFINGDWLTSILAKKQYYFINGITIILSPYEKEHFRISDMHTEGALFEFDPPFKIVALGASTTANRSTITGVYCQRLPEYFKKHNVPVHIFNEGIGGNTTQHALNRFENAVLSKQPHFVIINLGLNDSWVDSDDPKGESRISLFNYQKNILHMMNVLKEKNVRVILMTPNALGKNIAHYGESSNWRYKRSEKYIKTLRKIAKKEKIPLIDQWRMMNKLAAESGRQVEDFLLPDSMHTNDLWHKISAEKISQLIIEVIKGEQRIINNHKRILVKL